LTNFVSIEEAYHLLSDPAARDQYNIVNKGECKYLNTPYVLIYEVSAYHTIILKYTKKFSARVGTIVA